MGDLLRKELNSDFVALFAGGIARSQIGKKRFGKACDDEFL